MILALYVIPAIASSRGGDKYLYQGIQRDDAGGFITDLSAVVLGITILWSFVRHHNFRIFVLGLAAMIAVPMFAFHYWGKTGAVIAVILTWLSVRWAFRNWLK